MIYLVIYTADNCPSCIRVISSVKKITKNFPNVDLKIKNIREADRKITIVPAVYVNQDLFCYGDIDNEKLISLIQKQFI